MNRHSQIARRKGRPQGGFTLIEVTVALLLLSMVLTFVYESFVSVMNSKQRVEQRAELYQAARIALLRMEREIQSAYLEKSKVVQPGRNPNIRRPGTQPRPNDAEEAEEELVDPNRRTTGFVGESREAEGYPRDRLDFTTLAHYVMAAGGEDDRQSDHEEVAYFAETDYKEDRTDLLHRNDFTLDDDPMGGGDVFPLIEGIEGLNFRFLDPVRKSWEDNWNAEERGGLPAAVEIGLWIEDPRNEKKPLFFSKVVRVPLYTPTRMNDLAGIAGAQSSAAPLGHVIQDQKSQMQNVLGVQNPTQENPRVWVPGR